MIRAKHAFDKLYPNPDLLTQQPGLTVLYSPMSSGKTWLLDAFRRDTVIDPATGKGALLPDANILIVAPYKSAREDLGLKWVKGGDLNSSFLYTNQLVDDFLIKSQMGFYGDKPSVTQVTHMVDTWLDDYDLTGKLIMLDEIDFMWKQADMQPVALASGDTFKVSFFWEILLTALSKRCCILGFTATRIPSNTMSMNEIFLKAEGTVRIKSMKTYLYNNVTLGKVMTNAIDELHAQGKVLHSLFYKGYYTVEDIDAMVALKIKYGVEVLLVIRKDNAAVVSTKGRLDEYLLKHVGICIRDDDVTLEPNKIGYLLVDDDDSALNVAVGGADVFTQFDHVFINTSSSRQVSLRKQSSIDCRVINFGSNLTGTMLQVAGRFRHNPVILHNHLINKTQESVPYYAGEYGIQQFQSHDPHTAAYHLFPENVTSEWKGNLNALVGKRKSPATVKKQELLQEFLNNDYTASVNQKFIAYQQWLKVNHPDIKPYSIKTFYKAAQGVSA